MVLTVVCASPPVHAWTRNWRFGSGRNRVMSARLKWSFERKSYDAIGGVQGALAQRAGTIFAAMTGNRTNAQMEKRNNMRARRPVFDRPQT
jgi:hypothetical protein